MNVCYHGPLKDYSGYGEANRHAVAALDSAGVNVVAKTVSYVQDQSDFGELGAIVDRLLKNEGDYKIKILHTTPDQFKKHMEDGKYHIGHHFWETDKVPLDFAEGLALMNEIWTGSDANVEAIKAAGVDVPTYVFPQATQTDRVWPKPYKLAEFDGYLFYSIFEWTERKNPLALVNAYWQEFQGDENVGLLIKTYFKDFRHENRRVMIHEIERQKRLSGLSKFPPIFIYNQLMAREEVMRLHMTGDCFVSSHRGEGWGIPQVEAMLAGRPVISTGYAGVHEYLRDGETAVLLPYEMVPVHNMSHSRWYGSDQNWADVNREALRKAMRRIYEDQESAGRMALAGQEFVHERFSLHRVGSEMADRLREIEEKL